MTKITPAERVNNITEYYFSKKLKEIAALNAQGADIISLGIGGPDQMPPQQAIDTLCNEANQPANHSYQPYTGLPELRQSFAQWYKTNYGVTLNPDNEILPLIGSKEGVLHISLALLNPGDTVLVPNPGYPTYTSVSRLVGANIVTYDLTEDNGWLPDFEQLNTLTTQHKNIKLMWVNYPHMPTGTQPTQDLFTKLIQFAKANNIIIAHDNPYSFILNDNPQSILATPGAKDITIELNSLSKSHNMAGWRIGMAASNPTFISWITKVKSNIDSGQYKPMMLAAAQALKQPQTWYKNLNKEYALRRKTAEQIMTTLGCTYNPKQTGLFLWGRIPDDIKDAETLCDNILYNAKVFITPGSIFGTNGQRYIRISLCATQQKLTQALNRIKNIM